MNKYREYERYKDSGVEWIGEIPEEWEILKVSWIFNIIGSGTTPFSSNLDYYDGDIPWVNTGDLNDGYLYKTSKMITDLALNECSALKFYPINTLLIAMYGATIGKLSITKIVATTNQACCALAQPKKASIKFIFYWFLANRDHIISMAYGGGQPNISQNLIKSLRIPLPEKHEQNAIVCFLDQKTAEIDGLIADKGKLIELLQEKRQAIISEAVTKGLNPNVRMKDSGVEWIGEIPEHWEVTKLKYITNQIIDGTHSTPQYIDDGIPFLRVTDITNSRGKPINLNEVKYISEEEHKELAKRCNPKKGDLLVSKNGTIGIPKVIDWDYEFSIFVSLCLIKVNKKVDVYYCSYYFESNLIDTQIAFGGKTNTITNLHLDKIKEFIVLLPPVEEQKVITKYINNKTDEIDLLINDIQLQIQKLKEYRQSLISEAVTGKIDVRDYANN